MNRIITIGREFGSGGRELGRRLSELLQFAYYDQEIVSEIAKRTSMSEAYVQQIVEHKPLMSFPISIGRSFYAGVNPIEQQTQAIYVEQHRIIKELAEKSDCVIVGRCADYILKDRKDCLHAFIHADMDFRADRIVRLYGESENSPEKRLKDKDTKRRINYKHFTNRDWGMAQNYHITLNSGAVGIERCVDILEALYRGGRC